MAFGLAVPRFRVSNSMSWHTCLEQPPPPHLRVAFLLSRTFFGKPLGRIGVLKMLVFRPNKLGNKSVRIFARPLQAAGLDSLTPVAALIEPALDTVAAFPPFPWLLSLSSTAAASFGDSPVRSSRLFQRADS